MFEVFFRVPGSMNDLFCFFLFQGPKTPGSVSSRRVLFESGVFLDFGRRLGTKMSLCSGPKGRKEISPQIVSPFFPNGPIDPPLLMVQTTDLVVSCSDLQPVSKRHMYFCKGYVDIRTETHADLVSLVGNGSLSEYSRNFCKNKYLQIRLQIRTAYGEICRLHH